MVRTMMSGEGDEYSRQYEIEMLEEMLKETALGDRRSADAMPIGRRILQAEVFGIELRLAPFEFPEPHFPLRREANTN
jgi:hypothetical protein